MPGIGIVKYEELQKIWASSMNGELNSEIPPNVYMDYREFELFLFQVVS